MLLSIIIPVYNVERYLKECLDSCINQQESGVDLEIIIVNDGSTDNSLGVLNTFSWKGIEHTIISQKNKGLSCARNRGLLESKGDYVWFVDSDDWISDRSLKVLQPLLYKDVDLVSICAANVERGTIRRRMERSAYLNEIFVGKNILLHQAWNCCVPFHVYKRDFLVKNRLTMLEDIFHEDLEFSPRVYFWATKVMFTNELLYYVRINPNSITRTVNPKKGFDLLLVASSLNKFTKLYVEDNLKPTFNSIICTAINNALRNVKYMTVDSKHEFIQKLKLNFQLPQLFFKSRKIKHKIQSFFFIFFCNF